MQHSGHWGNYVPNPALRLAQVLSSMKDEHGRVTIPGFYDGIAIDAETRRVLEAVPEDIPALHRRLGIAAPDRVASGPQEAIQYPSLNVRGLKSAWVGDEARTVVPDQAVAEIDLRLVREERTSCWPWSAASRPRLPRDQRRDPTDEGAKMRGCCARHASLVSSFRTEIDSEPGRLTSALERSFGEQPVIIGRWVGRCHLAIRRGAQRACRAGRCRQSG
jgi:hypothetical protein